MQIHSKKAYEKVMEYKKLTENKRMTIASVARRFNIPRQTVSGWYHGKRPLFEFLNGYERKDFKKIIPETAKILTPNKAYILGVICGDGYINYKDMYISLETICMKFIKRFQESVVEIYGTIFKGKITPTCNRKYRIVICGKWMVEDLKKYLGDKKGTFSWRVPPKIISSSENCKINFIKGFFDSEGTVCKRYSLNFWSSNIEGLNQIKELLNDLDIMSSDIKPYREGNCNRLYITGKKNIIRFIKLIGTNIPYKYNKMKYLLEKYNLPVVA